MVRELELQNAVGRTGFRHGLHSRRCTADAAQATPSAKSQRNPKQLSAQQRWILRQRSRTYRAHDRTLVRTGLSQKK